jgi:hypothetical protein
MDVRSEAAMAAGGDESTNVKASDAAILAAPLATILPIGVLSALPPYCAATH